MEDLSIHSRVFDQVGDPPDEGFCQRIALDAAAMHAKYWEAPLLAQSWISSNPGRYVFPMDNNSRQSPEQLPTFERLWRQMYGTDLYRAPGCGQAQETFAILCGPHCDAIHDYFYEAWSSRPHTLIHSDLRADTSSARTPRAACQSKSPSSPTSTGSW